MSNSTPNTYILVFNPLDRGGQPPQTSTDSKSATTTYSTDSSVTSIKASTPASKKVNCKALFWIYGLEVVFMVLLLDSNQNSSGFQSLMSATSSGGSFPSLDLEKPRVLRLTRSVNNIRTKLNRRFGYYFCLSFFLIKI